MLGALAIAAIVFVPEVRAAAKTSLKPLGLIWIGSAATLVIAARRRCSAAAIAAAIVFLTVTVCGSPILGVHLMRSLEAPYLASDPFEQGDFDAVIVLGGGVADAPNGQAELIGSGDRLALAARLYHAGLAKRLLCTGADSTPHAPERNPAVLAKEILAGFGVPRDAVVPLRGADTPGEAAAVAEYLRKSGAARRGLVTSARHLRRAELWFSAAGVEVVPLPADFRTLIPPWRLRHLVPCAEGLSLFSVAANEWTQYASARRRTASAGR